MNNLCAWHHTFISKPKFLWVLIVLLLATATTEAQNTKGDKPAPTQMPAKEGKGKLFGKMRSGNARANSGRARVKNVFPQSGPFVNNPSKEPRKTRPSNVRLPSAHRVQRSPGHEDKAVTRTIGGGRITVPRSSSGRITKVYPQRGPFVNNPSPSPKKERPTSVRLPSSVKTIRTPSGRDRAYTKGPVSGARIPPRPNARAVSRNVFPQKGPFVNNPSPRPKRPDANPRNQPLHQARRLSMSKAAAQARSMGMRGAGFQTITAQFLTRGKKNVYWGKFRKKEEAITTDIAGRRLRTLNYHSPRPGLVGRDTLPFFRRTPRVTKRQPSAPLGGYQSATRTGRAWSGDVSGNKLRHQAARPNRERAGSSLSPTRRLSLTAKGERAGKFFMPRKMSVTPRGERTGNPLRSRPTSATRKSEKASLNPVSVKAPGLGAIAMFQFSRRAHGKRKVKGAGGSVREGVWNNYNQPLAIKGMPRNYLRISGFSGYAKTSRPAKGGGSISGKLWNNQNQPIEVRTGGRGTRLAGLYSGSIKARRPAKGGGSISGQLWNNQNRPIEVRRGGQGTRAAGLYAGNIKTKRPAKGGGSISGQLWNNNNQPIEVRTGGTGSRAAGLYAGNIKARRPSKGGGSISGQIWNNKNQPIEVRTGGRGSREGGLYQGNIKYKKPLETAGKPATYSGRIPGVIAGNGISQVGLNYTGDRRLKKPGIDNKKSTGIASVIGGKSKGSLPATHIRRDEKMAGFSGKIPGVLPGAGMPQIGLNYTGARKADSYIQNPKANKESLRKIKHPGGLALNVPILNQMKRSVNAGHYNHVMKQYWDYVKAPNSKEGALKVREPGKATARIGDLQVNVKMHKPTDAQMHPDAKWANSLRDNVKEERTFLMNVRLTWAKLFKRDAYQPRNLKEKPGKPRFDPGEKDLWYK